MNRKGSVMKVIVFFGLFLLALAMAIIAPTINSQFLGINLQNADPNLIILVKLAFVVIGLGFLAGTLEHTE